ncbi:MAG: transcriptional regulator [Microbacteriaceae bacterium]|jgi:DNA-binding HxlR family transcriptional regulator|nr:transcriptional regulator [Microbacteriaceae bacterium]
MANRTPALEETTAAEHSGPRMSEYESACMVGGRGDAIRDVLGHIGDKWTLLIVGALSARYRLRFTELQRHIPGISQRMLTVTLRHLERDGMVIRTMHAEVPPRVEYELTSIGRTLIEPARELSRWAIGSYTAILDSRERFDAAIAEPKATRRSDR